MLGASLALTLSAGATLKGDCFGADKRFWRSRLCYTDIQPLYHGRGIDRHVFPYIHATLTGGVGRHGFNEYPVLTGMVMWATGWVSASVSSYLAVTMVELALCAMLAAWLLRRMVALRALFWTLSPILVVYAFQNWDLLAVGASVAGLYLWWSGRPRTAGVAFAVGGAFKLYPALFVIPLVIDQLAMRKPRRAAEVGLAGFGSLLLINLPFILINASGWWATYRFHADRAPTTSGTIWAVLDPTVSTGTENRVSFLALSVALLVITVTLVRTRPLTGYPVVEWCAAATTAFILLNKVSSPQYVLWLVPFLALLRMSAIWWWLFSIIAVVRYVALFGVSVVPIGTGSADHVVHDAVIVQSLLLALYAAAILVHCRNTTPDLVPRSPSSHRVEPVAAG